METRTEIATAVFRARQLTKVYHMGEVDVHALRGADLDLFESEFVVILGTDAVRISTSNDGRAARRVLTIGQRNSLEAEVLSGLQPGDVVIVHPSDAVEEGVRVAPRS